MYKACVFLKIANTCHSVSLPQNSFIFQQKPTPSPRVHNWTVITKSLRKQQQKTALTSAETRSKDQ